MDQHSRLSGKTISKARLPRWATTIDAEEGRRVLLAVGFENAHPKDMRYRVIRERASAANHKRGKAAA